MSIIKTADRCVNAVDSHCIGAYTFVQNRDKTVTLTWSRGGFKATAHVVEDQSVNWTMELNGEVLPEAKPSKDAAKRFLNGLTRADAVFGLVPVLQRQNGENEAEAEISALADLTVDL